MLTVVVAVAVLGGSGGALVVVTVVSAVVVVLAASVVVLGVMVEVCSCSGGVVLAAKVVRALSRQMEMVMEAYRHYTSMMYTEMVVVISIAD